MVQLTPEQSAALRSAGGQPVAVMDPETRRTYFLVSNQDRDLLEELHAEARVVKAFSDASLQDSLQRLRSNP